MDIGSLTLNFQFGNPFLPSRRCPPGQLLKTPSLCTHLRVNHLLLFRHSLFRPLLNLLQTILLLELFLFHHNQIPFLVFHTLILIHTLPTFLSNYHYYQPLMIRSPLFIICNLPALFFIRHRCIFLVFPLFKYHKLQFLSIQFQLTTINFTTLKFILLSSPTLQLQ